MFEGSFREAQEQAVDLELMEGVISKRSVEALFQWLYLGIVKFNIEDPEEKISAAIELARLADRYEITGIESQMAEFVYPELRRTSPMDLPSYHPVRCNVRGIMHRSRRGTRQACGDVRNHWD